MNRFVCALFALVLPLASFAATDSSQLATAQELWGQREYTIQGASYAFEAAQIYQQQADLASSPEEKAELLIHAARGYYFYAHLSDKLENKMKYFALGVQAADDGLAPFNILKATEMTEASYQNLNLDEAHAELIARLLYERAASFGQWLKARSNESVMGKIEAMNRFGELETSAKGMLWVKRPDVNFHGYERVLGYALFNKGMRLGGSFKEQGYQMLDAGFKATFDPAIKTSVYGSNTVFLAEALKGKGQAARAKQILRDLVKVKVESLAPGFAIENRKAQADAQALLKAWD